MNRTEEIKEQKAAQVRDRDRLRGGIISMPATGELGSGENVR
jgi:hypothetical protein